MAGGGWRVRRDGRADYQSLRRQRFGCELVPLPASLSLSARDAEINRHAKLAIAR